MSAVEHGITLARWVYRVEAACPVLTLTCIGADYLARNYAHVAENEPEKALSRASLLLTALTCILIIVGFIVAVAAGNETMTALTERAIKDWMIAAALIFGGLALLYFVLSQTKVWPWGSDAIAGYLDRHGPKVRRAAHLISLPLASAVCLLEFGLLINASLH